MYLMAQFAQVQYVFDGTLFYPFCDWSRPVSALCPQTPAVMFLTLHCTRPFKIMNARAALCKAQ